MAGVEAMSDIAVWTSRLPCSSPESVLAWKPTVRSMASSAPVPSSTTARPATEVTELPARQARIPYRWAGGGPDLPSLSDSA